MEAAFLKILDMSLTASYVICAVLLLRCLLRRAPKKYSYALWSVVGFRLACPFSFEAVFSLFSLRPAAELPARVSTAAAYGQTPYRAAPSAGRVFTQLPVTEGLPSSSPAETLPNLWLHVAVILWCTGMAALLLYSLITYCRLSSRMQTAIRLEGNVYQSDKVRSPFILGFFRPRIYIPFGLDPDTQRYVLTHEHHHLRCLDHWAKAWGFLLLTLHWFNPLVWLAFCLMGKDMEMRCDEKVLTVEENSHKAYSISLLGFAANRRFPAPCPLAFGETGVKARIKHVLRWKKPKIWVTVLAAALCIFAVAACAANPKESPSPEASLSSEAEFQEEDEESAEPLSILVQVNGQSQTCIPQYYPDGFEFQYEELPVLTVSGADSLIFQSTPELETLTVGEDFYTQNHIRRETYELPRTQDGTFQLEIQRSDPAQTEEAVYYIPHETGEYVLKVQYLPEDPWGLELTAAAVTADSLELSFRQYGGAPTGELQTGSSYWLEVYDAGQWSSIAPIPEEYAWTSEAYIISKNETTVWEVSWKWLYGSLSPGVYRIGKQITDFRAAGDYDTRPYYAEFTISNSLPEEGTGQIGSKEAPISVIHEETSLNAAISQAILEHNATPYTGKYFACEDHIILSHLVGCGAAVDEADPKAVVGHDTVYLMMLYQEFTIDETGVHNDGSGVHCPIALSFQTHADGTRTLTEYWTPQDGAGYADSIREKFPPDACENALDTQKYILQQIQSCYSQAVAYSRLETDPVIEELLDAYLKTQDPIVYRELTYYGDFTLQYLFRAFLQGGQTGANGNLMRQLMDELLGAEAISLETDTAQAYFDAWLDHAKETLQSQSELDMQMHHPKAWMLLQMLQNE